VRHNLEESHLVQICFETGYFFMRDYFAVVYLEPEDFDLIALEIGGSETQVLPFVEHKSCTLNCSLHKFSFLILSFKLNGLGAFVQFA